MDPRISSEIRTILTEFDKIKGSLSPIIAEVKKMQEMHVELRRLREETDSRLKKLDFEVRRLSQREPPLKDVVSSKTHIDDLSRQIESLRRQYAGVQKIGDISREVDRHVREAMAKMPPKGSQVNDDVNEARAENKRAISMLKNDIKEVDDKHTKIMSTTREKTAALITEANHLSKQVEDSLKKHDEALRSITEFENWFKHSEKTLMSNDQMTKSHVNQLVNEINNNRKDIHFSKKELEKVSQKMNDFTVLVAKLEKRQTTELSEMKGRMRDIERKIVFKPEIDKIQNSLATQQKEELLRMTNELSKVKEQLVKDSKMVQSTFESKHSGEIAALKNAREQLLSDIKVINEARASDMGEIKKKFELWATRTVELKQKINAESEGSRGMITALDKRITESTLKEDVEALKKKLDSLSIKVANTSKLIEELEKVL
jgi:chromosome segregation ATPase